MSKKEISFEEKGHTTSVILSGNFVTIVTNFGSSTKAVTLTKQEVIKLKAAFAELKL